MSELPITIVGMVWYRREDWPKLKAIFADTERFQRGYDGWLEAAEEGFQSRIAQGQAVEKVYINPDDFVAWCAAAGMDVDGKARNRFVNESLARKYQNGG